jgi:hypothetical protein
MNENVFSLDDAYWKNFSIQSSDIEFVFSYLLELEEPQTPNQILNALVLERIKNEKILLGNKRNSLGHIYYPKENYEIGQKLIFPSLNWMKGDITNIRTANNPEIPSFDIIIVSMEDGTNKEFASNLANHKLNIPISIGNEDPNLDLGYVISHYGDQILAKVTEDFESNPDLVMIAGKWFPKSLLVNVNIGHLNLIEAILEEANGGPLPTDKLICQVEIPSNINPSLIEFSFNYAIQEDHRFDEVGPAGETLWYLKRLEPSEVQNQPELLKYSPLEINNGDVNQLLAQLGSCVHDEYSEFSRESEPLDQVTISLIYPHWRLGTLPLSNEIKCLFPTAYEAPRVQFSFIDADSKDVFSGWVVRPSLFVYGLKEWYEKNGLIPGSLVSIIRGEKAGEVILKVEKRRQNREWIRTVLIGADGGVVFAMLKQTINATYDDRMAIVIPDIDAVDAIWSQSKQKFTLENSINIMSRELAKLNPQGHIHVQELYAAVNLIKRCPPGPIIDFLLTKPNFANLDNLYFRIKEPE